MDGLLNKRLFLITGKGGVGRSTVSSAIAVAAARSGRRVLLTEITESYGDYSPLARIFGRDEFPATPTEVAPGIRGCVLHARTGHEGFLRSVMPVKAIVRAAVRSKALRYLLEAAPSFHEMGIFYHLLTLLRERHKDTDRPEHELLIIDMPATGHTLALTSLPDILLKLMPKGPIAASMRAGQSYVNNPEKASAFIVTLPETLPVTECLELLDGLRETRVPVGGVIVNKLVSDLFTQEERQAIAPLLESQSLYGATRFHRFAESQLAVRRLREAIDVPLLEVPEFAELGDALINAVANVLSPPDDIS